MPANEEFVSAKLLTNGNSNSPPFIIQRHSVSAEIWKEILVNRIGCLKSELDYLLLFSPSPSSFSEEISIQIIKRTSTEIKLITIFDYLHVFQNMNRTQILNARNGSTEKEDLTKLTNTRVGSDHSPLSPHLTSYVRARSKITLSLKNYSKNFGQFMG